ncbi:dihydrodipicolinate synthase family protein ['Osedax' symbiont bacterium Rs2_46_30_T18]|nr:dihydrodipicolinate synthase family protein ['Osedax' symbiont bacterium Rs2_46_30_T18]
MTKITHQSSGVFVISATPFSENGSLDLHSTESLIEFYLQKQVTGITILGMMGEAPKLSGAETMTFMQHVLKIVDQRVPVVVGVSQPGIDNLVQLSHTAMDSGAAGVMIAPPPTIKHEQALYQYYATCMQKLGAAVPVCYQDFPLATNVHISVPMLAKLFADFEQLVMLKHEDWPGLNKITQLREAVPEMSILVGNGGIFLPQELERGADGAMTGFAFPEMLVEVWQLQRLGKLDLAEDIFEAYLPLVRHEQQPGFGLAVRKEVLRRRGAISCALTRQPGPQMHKQDHLELDRMLRRLDKRLTQLRS